MTNTMTFTLRGDHDIALMRGPDALTAWSPALLVEADGRASTRILDAQTHEQPERVSVTGLLEGTSLRVEWSARRLSQCDSWEFALRLTNTGSSAVAITRMDPLALRLAESGWRVLSFTSSWGKEFEPVESRTGVPLHFSTRSGRSSHGTSPWVGLEREGVGLVVVPVWSGNWHVDVTEDGTLTAGISPWQFETILEPGASLEAPSVALAAGDDIECAAGELTSSLVDGWLPRSEASERLDVEWNHWWPYEDVKVNEEVIASNTDVAAELGFEVVTVDAGWFGEADSTEGWLHQRGDWQLVNRARFPQGLAALGDEIRVRGVRAGIWIEPEAVSGLSELRRTRPDILALSVEGRPRDTAYRTRNPALDPDDPTFLAYVCLGSAGGREFVTQQLDRLVAELGAEWLKFDFNLDPDAGCTRTDHGHGARDGLLRHYQGLYEVLDRFREDHPEVVLEACASGGQRFDIGLARHVHCLYLSDPDYTEHHLQVLWGASMFLPAVALLHWSWSQWLDDLPIQRLDFDTLSPEDFAATLRAAMLHRFGVSLRLPELRPALREVLREHVRVYQQYLAPVVRRGVIRRLTTQPMREGRGERCPAFQLDAGEQHVVAQFRLAGGTTPAAVRPRGLDPDAPYRVTELATTSATTATPREVSGARLMSDGVALDDRDGAESSWLFLLERLGS